MCVYRVGARNVIFLKLLCKLQNFTVEEKVFKGRKSILKRTIGQSAIFRECCAELQNYTNIIVTNIWHRDLLSTSNLHDSKCYRSLTTLQ